MIRGGQGRSGRQIVGGTMGDGETCWVHRHGDPRGPVLKVQLPGETESVAV